jgi:hypothetical protein
MQTLLQVTGSVTNSQKILAQAINVSRATGIDLTTVAQDLGQAYVGNTRGLRKYSLGLTQAELKTASFADITDRMTKLFGGANEAYLSTYAGQMERLAVAAGEAQETIGKGLVDALANLAGGGTGGIDKVIKAMEDLSFYTGKFIRGFGGQIGALGKLLTGDLKGASALLNASSQNEAYKGAIPSISGLVQASEQKKAEVAALKRQKALTSEKGKQLTIDKAKASLAKAQATFDITKINLAAALKGKVTKDEENRLLALQAIENGNGEEALKYIAKIDAAREAAAAKELARQKLSYEDALAKIAALNAAISSRQSYLLGVGMGAPATSAAAADTASGYSQSFLNNPYVLGGSPESLGLSDRANTERNAAMNVNLFIDGQQVAASLVNSSNSGTSSSSSRNTGQFK